MPYTTVNDINIYFEEYGTGEPLILLHGATDAIDGPFSAWGALANSFSQHYRTILIEHRGHGRTNNPRDYLTYELIADDVCKFIESTVGKSTHIGGMSDGAIVALHIGMTRPDLVETLLCVGANYYDDDLAKEANKFADVSKIEQETPEIAVQYSITHDRNKQPGYWRTLVEQIAKNLATAPNYTIEDLQKISAPTLLMSGENDLWANRKQMLEMRQHIPISEMLIVNNAGHNVQITHPHIIGPIMLDFLQRH